MHAFHNVGPRPRACTPRWGQLVALSLGLAGCGDSDSQASGDDAGVVTHFSASWSGIGTVTVTKPPVYIRGPRLEPAYEVAEGSAWRRLTDQRPTDSRYIVGATVNEPRALKGECLELIQGAALARPADYVKVGTMQAPGAAGDAPQLPVIEARPVTGMVRLRLTFFTDPACATAREEVVLVEGTL